jgi:hypothetical protein
MRHKTRTNEKKTVDFDFDKKRHLRYYPVSMAIQEATLD